MPAQSMAALQSGTRDALLKMEKHGREEEGNDQVSTDLCFWFLLLVCFIRFAFDSFVF